MTVTVVVTVVVTVTAMVAVVVVVVGPHTIVGRRPPGQPPLPGVRVIVTPLTMQDTLWGEAL